MSTQPPRPLGCLMAGLQQLPLCLSVLSLSHQHQHLHNHVFLPPISGPVTHRRNIFLNTVAKGRVVRWMSGEIVYKIGIQVSGVLACLCSSQGLAFPASRGWPGLHKAWQDPGPTARAPTMAAQPLSLPEVTAASCLFKKSKCDPHPGFS